MSKITNDALAQNALSLYPYGNSGRQRVKVIFARHIVPQSVLNKPPIRSTTVINTFLSTHEYLTRRCPLATSSDGNDHVSLWSNHKSAPATGVQYSTLGRRHWFIIVGFYDKL